MDVSIRAKVAAIVVGIFMIYGITDFCIQKFVIFPSFLTLEQHQAAKDMDRVRDALTREIAHIDSFARDWAAWDETYAFVASRSQGYIDTNITYPTLRAIDMNLICICDMEGNVVFEKIYDLGTEKEISLPEIPMDRLPVGHPLHPPESVALSNLPLSGILMTARGPIMIGSRPILTSSYEGPSRGRLIMGSFLTDSKLKTIQDQTKVNFTLLPPGTDGFQAIVPNLNVTSPFLIKTGRNDRPLNIYSAYQDILGNTAFVINADIPRDIAAEGLNSLRHALFSIVAAGIFALVGILFLIQKTLLNPIIRLTHHITEAKQTGDISNRPRTRRRDEVGVLAQEFNILFTHLAHRSAELEKLNVMLREDIDKRRRVEQALRESRERVKTVLDRLPVSVFVHDLEGRYYFVNQTAVRATGYSEEEFRTMSVEAVAPASLVRHDRARLWLSVSMGRAVILEATHIRKDGSGFPAEMHLSSVTLEGRPLILAIAFDITERKQTMAALRESEEKLLRLKKMESLGLLAGGVAHDLNNVLSGIINYPELLLLDLPEESNLRQPLMTIQNSGWKAAAIVNDLLTVARGVAVEKHPINLNDVVSSYLKSPEHRRLLGYHPAMTVKTDLAPHLLNTRGSAIHLGKVVMNLVSNAAEALPGIGEVRIATSNRYVDTPIRGYTDIPIGEYAVLAVTDTGSGIGPQDLERIFEPFFSKKVLGRSGTGLGLAIVWNTVQEHDGYINITVQNGTTFELYFPITREELRVEKADSIEAFQGNGETILVVDDIDTQRKIFCQMLEVLGYRGTAVSSGEEAIDYLQKHSVDLVLLDMIMDPGMNGRETYEKIVAVHPEQRTIIVSGYSETEDIKKMQELGAGPYLKKPASLTQLGAGIRDALKKI